MVYSLQQADARLRVSRGAVGKWVRRRKRLGVTIPGLLPDGQIGESFFAYWAAEHARDIRLAAEHVRPVVTGLTPISRKPSADELWADVERLQGRDEAKVALRYSQEVVIDDDRPVLLVLLSDVHFGNAHTDYTQAKRDAELVRDTDGVYAAVLGDVVDNWITPTLAHIQREQPMTLVRELALAESWLCMMQDKLVAVVSGNHDLRTYELAGLDLLAGMLAKVKTLYDQHEINFTLRVGGAVWRWKLRHQWGHRSQLNSSNPMEWDARHNDGTWDFAVGGHVHTPTLLRPFIDHAHDGRKKAAIQLGSYSLDSPYGRALGLHRIVPGGSLGIMLWPDGDWQEFYSLEKAARFLEQERSNVDRDAVVQSARGRGRPARRAGRQPAAGRGA